MLLDDDCCMFNLLVPLTIAVPLANFRRASSLRATFVFFRDSASQVYLLNTVLVSSFRQADPSSTSCAQKPSRLN